MTKTQYLTRLLGAALILALALSPGYAAVVTLCFDGENATSDTDTLEPMGVQVEGGQIGVYVQSHLQEAQEFTLKTEGLTEPTYDLYVNGSFDSEKTAQALGQGITLRTGAGIADPAMIRSLTESKDRVDAEYARLQDNKDDEARRINYTLSLAGSWIRAGLKEDMTVRSAEVILAPSGRALKNMSFPIRRSVRDSARTITRSCWLMQQARSRMYNVIKDPDLRNSAVVALTPVDFNAVYSVGNGSGRMEAELINNCDLPISGNITMALPKGWTTNAGTLDFKDIKSGETFKLSFDLVPPASGGEAPGSLPIAANVTVVQDELKAVFKLRVVATGAAAAE